MGVTLGSFLKVQWGSVSKGFNTKPPQRTDLGKLPLLEISDLVEFTLHYDLIGTLSTHRSSFWLCQRKDTSGLGLSRTFKTHSRAAPQFASICEGADLLSPWTMLRFTQHLGSLVPAAPLEVLSFTFHEARGPHRTYTLRKVQLACLSGGQDEVTGAPEPRHHFVKHSMRKRVARGAVWDFPALQDLSTAQRIKKIKKLRRFLAGFVPFGTQ